MFSLFGWQVAFASKFEENIIPWARQIELGVLELSFSLWFFKNSVTKPETQYSISPPSRWLAFI